MAKDYVGKMFGKLTITRRLKNNTHGHIFVECLCDCGNIKDVALPHLQSGHTKSCGCLRESLRKEISAMAGSAGLVDYSGSIIDGWLILNNTDRSTAKVKREAKCLTCGEIKYVIIINGRVQSSCDNCRDLAYISTVNELCSTVGYTFHGVVGDVLSQHSKLILECPLHGVWETTSYAKFVHIGRRCPSCAKTGFDINKPSVLYVLKVIGKDCFTGFGITNVKRTRFSNHRGNLKKGGCKIEEVYTIEFDNGINAIEIEGLLKKGLTIYNSGIVGFKTEATKDSFEFVVNELRGYLHGKRIS